MVHLSPEYLSISILAFLLVTLLCAVRYIGRSVSAKLPFPPGPKPLPILGNLLDIPALYQWLTYGQWKHTYGDVIHLKVLGNHVIVLNSLEAVTDLLEKRSSIYSDRPRMPMFKELMGWEWSLGLVNYGHDWRKHRRVFHQHFNFEASKAYANAQTLETRRMLLRLLHAPEKFRHHIRHLTVGTILRISYGIDVQDTNDELIQLAETAMEGGAVAGIPGTFLVDLFPLLKYVPSWLPGARFRILAEHWRRAITDLRDIPFEIARQAAAPSTATAVLKHLEATETPTETERIAKNIAGVAFIGGSDTTTSSLATLFVAMVLHPEYQKAAQAEIDAVLANGRLPEFSDIPSLPYIQAIMKEVIRWQQVLPLALAHMVTTDDVYQGYRIPKGATVLGNAWAILHDEKHYKDPHLFNPERFLRDGKIDPRILDPGKAAFGFGRRICPGRHIATNSMLIAFASILACFNIEPALDGVGKPVIVEMKMSPGLMSYPEDFKCAVKPRHSTVPALIKQFLELSEMQESA